jgi:hypothetical protein
MNKIEVYASGWQQKFLRSRARIKTALCGRGSGKTNLIGKVIYLLFLHMPRARYLLVGQTYISLDLVTLSEVKDSLEGCGVYEFNATTTPLGHYVVGVKPPAHWPKPYKKVTRLGYQYCMTFINGLTIQLVSQDNSETQRGLNSDGALVDERGSIKSELLKKVIYPTIRGNKDKHFAKSHLHHCIYEFGSAPWTSDGQTMYATEEEYQKEQVVRKKMGQDELKANPPTFLWIEATCLDNPFTGEEYYNRMKEILDGVEFDIEVANMRLTSLPNGYYHAFSTNTHCYLPSNSSFYRDPETGLYNYKPNDYRSEKELNIALDFNSDICWTLVIQNYLNAEKIINSKYVKPSINQAKSILKQGAQWFCDTYKDHPVKEVNLYGDPNGNSRNANTDEDNKPFFEEYAQVLKDNGWKVNRKESPSYPNRVGRYRLMNGLLSGELSGAPAIEINQIAGNNKALIIAIQCTPVMVGEEAFKKDKSSERSSTVQREYATDATDAFDYYLYTKYKKLLPGKRKIKNHLKTF